jgi:hypothetical protein
MTNEERKELRTAFSIILANVSQLQRQTDALVKALAQKYPAIHEVYEKALDAERANPVNASASLLEHLDRTLLRNKE